METNAGVDEAYVTGLDSLFKRRTADGWKVLYILLESRRGKPRYVAMPGKVAIADIGFGGKFQTTVKIPPVQPGDYTISKEFAGHNGKVVFASADIRVIE